MGLLELRLPVPDGDQTHISQKDQLQIHDYQTIDSSCNYS